MVVKPTGYHDDLWRGDGPRWMGELPARFAVKGCDLERIREYYNFWIGTRMAGIGNLKAGMSRAEMFLHVYPAMEVLGGMVLDKFKWFPMCSGAGIVLMQVMTEFVPSEVFKGQFPDLEIDPWKLSEFDLTRVREAAKAFDNSISLQFDELDVYRVMPKGTHDTRLK
jgi:hypothetical protein